MTDMTRRTLLALGGGAAAGSLAAPTTAWAEPETGSPMSSASTPEPNVDVARTWWSPQRQVWTPVGWKGHLFRFDVFYNGTTICQPAIALPPSGAPTLKPYLTPYKGKDFQLTPVMPDGGGFPKLPEDNVYLHKTDFGVGIQSWQQDVDTPILRTDWRRQEGLVLRQSQFAHVKGGQAVETALEPIYSWMRYEIAHVDELTAPETFEFVLRLSRLYYQHYVGPPQQQEAFLTIQLTPSAAPLANPLVMDRVWNPEGKPLTVNIRDENGDVRLVVGTPAKGTISMRPADGYENVFDLHLSLPVVKGNHIDVLLPMLPQPAEEAEREWALGREGALAECQPFWRPQQAAKISTPEEHVNQYFRRSVQLAEVIAEKSPDSGKYTFLTGSFGYDLLWSTPTSMVSHMFLDLLGQHEIVARHLDLYRDVQGKRQPPGRAYEQLDNDGFFATPLSLQSFDWLGDHGAILEAAARHALLSRDSAFLDKWLEPIVKACDFIKRACASTDHKGIKGLMPGAASNDTGVEQQSVWIQVWNYKGLASSVELLKRINHPRAAEFATLATSFRQTYAKTMRDAAATTPKWTAPDGSKHPTLPSKFEGPESPWPYLEAFDSGALSSVWSGLMDASDPLMRSYVDFFRVGPNTELFDPNHHTALDRVVLDHEQSSGEPCYSWNLFHTWQLKDRHRFLEGMYGLMIGACSPDTYIACEHRNAMYGSLFVQPLVTWAARHAVIDDAITPGELHLLRLCPLAWVSATEEASFERMPTLFGPMSLRFKLQAEGRELAVTFSQTWQQKPSRIVLHCPPIPGLLYVIVNGRRRKAADTIVL